MYQGEGSDFSRPSSQGPSSQAPAAPAAPAQSTSRPHPTQKISDSEIGWEAFRYLASSLNPWPKKGEKRKFSPLRPFKSIAVYLGCPAACLFWLGMCRAQVSSAPLSSTASEPVRLGHAIGTSFVAPATSAGLNAAKATLVGLESGARYSEKGNKPLSATEVKQLEAFAGKKNVVPVVYTQKPSR